MHVDFEIVLSCMAFLALMLTQYLVDDSRSPTVHDSSPTTVTSLNSPGLPSFLIMTMYSVASTTGDHST